MTVGPIVGLTTASDKKTVELEKSGHKQKACSSESMLVSCVAGGIVANTKPWSEKKKTDREKAWREQKVERKIPWRGKTVERPNYVTFML